MSPTPRSAEDYWLQMSESGLTEVELRVSSAAEAKEALDDVKYKQKQLRHLKQNVNLEMRRIRAEYRQGISKAEQAASGIMGRLAGRKVTGPIVADQKRRLTKERNVKLQPYDEFKLKIDEMLIQMDGAKLQLEQFIDATDAP